MKRAHILILTFVFLRMRDKADEHQIIDKRKA